MFWDKVNATMERTIKDLREALAGFCEKVELLKEQSDDQFGQTLIELDPAVKKFFNANAFIRGYGGETEIDGRKVEEFYYFPFLFVRLTDFPNHFKVVEFRKDMPHDIADMYIKKLFNAIPPEQGVLFSGAETASKLSRVKWAEGLIRQLPKNHEGRNSWLMNYGKSEEADEIRERNRKDGHTWLYDELYQSYRLIKADL